MSQQLANHLKSYGRNGDTELVHMTKGEIKGLQELAMAHGGSLSINPNTGLVEAGFLKNLLPMVAGAGLMLIPGVGPLAAAGMVGGFETLRTGDVGRGLMAGLGAYGGAGLAGSLGSAGASAAGTAATEATMAANPQLAGSEIAREMGTAGFNAPTLATNANPATMTMADKLGAGFNQVTSSPQALGQFAGQNVSNIGFAAAPAIGDAMTPKPIDEIAPEKSSGRYLASDFEGYEPRRPNPYYRPQGLGYTGYAAQGGMMPGDLSYADGGMIDPMQRMPNGGLAAIQGQRDGYAPMTTMDGNIPQMAGGGSIGGYSDGGRMLKGPGDGMSDSIPAMIGKRQPARLADGEFVVPADVVSHLGNGSTDAGAKHLYNMMDKVRKARTGTKKQGKQIKPEKYMPVKKMADGGVTAPASSSSVVSPESLMGLADLSALGNMISNTRGPAAMYTPDQTMDKIAAARANRPVDQPVSLKKDETPEAIMRRFRLVYDQRPYDVADYNPATHAGNS
jgi:hypothetical protein